MHGCESWTIKKAECQRIDAFKLWYWRRLLDSKDIKPVNPKRNQSWIFIGRTDAEAEAPVLWPPDAKSWLIGKDPDAGKDWRWEGGPRERGFICTYLWCWEGLRAGGEGGDRGWDGWVASLTRWMWVWVNSGRWWWTVRPGLLQSMGSQRVRHDWATELWSGQPSLWDSLPFKVKETFLFRYWCPALPSFASREKKF